METGTGAPVYKTPPLRFSKVTLHALMALLTMQAAAVDYRGSSPGLAAVHEEATDGIEGQRWSEEQEGRVREPEGEARCQEGEEGRAGVLSGPSTRTRKKGRSTRPLIVGPDRARRYASRR